MKYYERRRGRKEITNNKKGKSRIREVKIGYLLNANGLIYPEI
jgi:hypothetical protein